MQSVPARQRATGQVHRTPHVHKLRYQGFNKKTSMLGHKNGLTRTQNEKRGVDEIYFLEGDVKAFSMQRTMYEPEQLLEVCCRSWPLCSDDARPVTARSPARHVSQ